MNTAVNPTDSPAVDSNSPAAESPDVNPTAPPDAISFPTSAMVGMGKEFVSLYKDRLESPPEFLYTAWNTCFGLAVAPHIGLNLTVYNKPRLYSVMLGESAWSRKSTGNNMAVEFWDSIGVYQPKPPDKVNRLNEFLGDVQDGVEFEVENAMAALGISKKKAYELLDELVGTAVAKVKPGTYKRLAASVSFIRTEAAPAEKWERLIRVQHGFGSVEGFAQTFNGRKGKEDEVLPDRRPTLVHYDELSAFVCKAKQKGSQLLPFVSQMFESENYDNDTVGSRAHVRDCHIGLLAATTRDTYDNMWSEEFLSIGLLNRLWLTLGHKTKSIAIPEPPSATALDELRKNTQRLLTEIRRWAAEHEGGIGFSSDGAKLWKEYYPEIEKGGVHSKRLDTYGFKWMTLLALSCGKFQVDRPAVEQTIKLLDYQLAVRKLCAPVEADNAVAKVEEKIRRCFNRRPKWTERELRQSVHADRSGMQYFTWAIQNLIKCGDIARSGVREYICAV